MLANTGRIHVYLLGTLKGADSYHLIPLGEDGTGYYLLPLEEKKEKNGYGTSHNFRSFLVDTSLDVFGIIILTNVKYFMTSNTVQKNFSSFSADLGFVRLTLTYDL